MKNVYSLLKIFLSVLIFATVTQETAGQCATAPTSISSSVAGCLKSGRSTTLTQVGGSLPGGGSYKWYEGSCGAGTSIGTGISITVSPTVTTNYYVRAEDGCGNTVCADIRIQVGDSSVAPTSINSIDSVCQNVLFKLKQVGGTLGTGATWQWYRVGCGGSGIPWVGHGDSIFTQMNPGISYYHVKAIGTCNTTSCTIKAVVIRDSSVRPTETQSATICLGNTKVFGINGGTPGGSLGFRAQWKWYSGSCGGTLVGTGSTLSVSPSATGTYTYYRRAEGHCNTTTCAVYTLTVTDSNITPTSISGPTAVCERSAPLKFTPVGGTLSPGATWTWTRVACHGSPGQVGLGSGDTLTLTTAVLGVGTHTFYVRGLNGCNTATNCVSLTLTISDTSVPANSISGTNTICLGQSSTLTFSGGKLGAGASWKWYEGSCGGTAVGTGTSLTVSPAVAGTYTYYLRAEGNCNNTNCISYIVTVRDTSSSPTSVSSSATTICLGQSINLTVNGGSLGHGASWKWYSGSCGGTSIGSGSSLTWGPPSAGTVNIYGRAEGTCNNTLCKTISVTVRDTSIPAIAIIGIDTICQNVVFKLKRSGGSLGFGAKWNWYRTACGGSGVPWVGTGDSIYTQMNPGTSYYYLKAEGNCNSTICAVKAVVIRDSSVRPTETQTATICLGTSKTFGINGGTPGGKLGAGAQWKWYSGSCGGTLVGTGSTLTITPLATGTYTYYRRAEGTCNTTTCATYTLTVTDSSKTPTSISGPTAVCQRSAAMVFKPVGGILSPGASWTWTRVACHGSSGQVGLGSGDSLSLTTAALGLGTHTIYVRGLNGCNTTNCVSITVTISDTSVPATSISGTNTICVGQSSTLTFSGGKLGAGGSWKWYEGSCGGTSVGTGTSLTVSPTIAGTYTYYLRAEGTCNNTICKSFTLTVRDTSVPAVSVNASKTTFCLSDTSLLTLSGGSLGTGATWKWYVGACGGISIGSGTSHVASPNRGGTFTYYVRAEGTCNNSICKTVTLTVRDSSVPANSISGTSTICKGQSSTLSLNGGSLGTGGSWKWYLGSCSGTSVATGSTYTASPTAAGTYTYYVRAEGTCNTTACRSFTLTVNDTSVPATSATATSTTICEGQSTTLSKNGGSLGTGATWEWYSGSCTGTPVGSGSSLSVTPNTTTTYYVKAKGTCNNTTCQSVTITVRDTSVPVTSISGTTTICRGQSSTLTLNGGSLGTGGSWKWYNGSCGGTSVGTGTTLTVTPSAGTYTYYVRAEGTCNNTVCKSVALTVNDTSVPATSATATSTTICKGQSTTLSKNGGSLGTGATWEWYSGSCTGTPVGSGSSLSVSPNTTTTYYVKAEGTCNNTACQSVTITVRDTSVPATVVTGTASTICKGESVTLTLNGGSLGTGGSWKWYSGSCGGTSIGTGTSLTLSPQSTVTYYVRAEGTCNNTVCKTYNVTVRDTSIPATSANAGSTSICLGQSTTVSVSGGSLGTGATWKWYSGSCTGTSIGSGSSLSVTPTTTTTYYVRAEGTCNNTLCKNVSVTVKDTSIPPTSISGPTSVCQRSAAMVFKPVGGTLSPGASWTWTRVACHGSSGQVGLGSGDSLVLTTGVLSVGTHTIYVRALNGCNTTNCVSKTFTISDTSVPAASISGTSTICVGQSSTLSISGGKLGAGGSWKWYSGSCGGTSVGTGSSLSVSPTTTITYYARAEGSCNTTNCQSFTVTVRDTSMPATSISGNTTICKGQSTTFTLSGGSLGTGGSWNWYNGSCGGTSVATGTTLTVTPSPGTYTYYVRAEGTCNNTICKTVTLTVRDTSVPATSISGTSTICKGQSSTLSLNGGSLGTGGSWKWYLGSCSGTSLATGSTYTASPSAAGTYTYYVRAEGTCNTTVCRSFTLTVSDTSVPASTVTAGSSSICLGQSTTLSLSGGSLGTGGSWKWYSGSCSGTSISTGTSLSVTPNTTTTYYVRAEGTCNNTVCKNVTVTVRDTSIAANSIIAADTSCDGQNIMLRVNGGNKGTGAVWQWYRNACGGSGVPFVGNGDTIYVKPGAGNHSYYVRASGICNTTNCVNKTIVVTDTAQAPSNTTANSICLGTSATLSVLGGRTGYKGVWKWYSTCGTGSALATGTTLTITPSSVGNKTYYVRAESACNTTACGSVSIMVNDTSKPATSISGPSSVCQRSTPVVLKRVGGSLSAGGAWNWYRSGCGGSGIPWMGSGDSISFTTSSLSVGTHTFYLKAIGGCNTTACVSFNLTINDTSIAPSTISASATTICAGESSTLTLSGGKLGAGASWKWYTAGCGVTSAGSGSSFVVSPSTLGSHIYYIRAEGTCGNTVCKNVTITVRDTSHPVVSISGNNTICLGTSTSLSVNGGSLASGASWKWYSGSCGGTSVGTGSSISVNPSSSTTYYVRAEGTCKNSTCKSQLVTVRDTSIPANSITGTTTICKGSSTTLSVSGGTLGSGASWKWFSGSCSGTPIGTGSSISVSPASNTTYYVRAEGTCNNTICRSTSITVRDTSIPALFISGNTTICRGQSNTFTLIGGTLGSSASWKWYSGVCGTGSSIATGTTLSVTPSAAGTYTYFVRAEGTCGNSACINVSLTVRDTSVPASSISGTTTICKGQSTTLSVVGGSLGHAASWKWYQGGCFGSFAGTGSSLTLSNLAPGNYTYYVKAEGTCNSTICRSISITVRDTSVPATSIIGTSTICKGQSSTLTLTGGSLGTGATWKWYEGTCGGTSVGSGTSITVTPNAGSYTYYVRAEGLCNNTSCQSFALTVRDTSSQATSVTGTLSTLCVGQSTTMTVNGGSLGTGASWKWYLGSCGFTTLSHTGTSYTLNPTVAGTYTYYVRAEGACNTTLCKSYTITVRDTSVAPSSISGTATLCQGQQTTLTMNGGYLGTGATWKWYLGNCGGTAIASGVTILTVSPASAGTYTYYVRAEGVCNNSICRSFTITMRDTSAKPISINGPDTVCEGVAINLSRNGGITGTGATWNWYRVACGGSGIPYVGSGDNISVKMPKGEHFFFLNASGVCNTTNCIVKKVMVVDTSIKGSNIVLSNHCLGGSKVLSVNGGRLGYKANWKWYSSCGTGLLGTGSSLTVAPTAIGIYTYYVRAEGPCNTTTCASVTFTVIDSSKPASSISGPLSVCPDNTPFTLKRVGGSLSPGARWDWYRNGCGGSGIPWVGTGDSITLTPQMLSVGTHNFYLKGNGGCNTTACTVFTLVIRQAPAAPSHIAGNTNICEGQSTTLSVNGGVQGTDANWTWYSGSCGGTLLGTGSSISVSPTDTTTYYVRSEGPCGITACAQVRVDVIHTPAIPTAITSNYSSACAGTPIKLYANGPALLNGEKRHWYVNNGGTLTPIGTGDSIIVTLNTTSDIELRTENRCFNSVSVTKQINIQNSPVGTWVGVKNSSWHESDNWCGGIPTSSTDVVIPAGTPYQPVITVVGQSRNLTINPGASLTVSSGSVIQLNGSFVQSGTFTSAGKVAFLSGGAITSDGFVTQDLEINLTGEVTLNGNVTVNGNLNLGKGSAVTGSYEVHVTNDKPEAIVSISGNTNFKNGWIAGNLRRNIKSVDSIYHFPVGSIAGGNNAEFITHNVTGVNSILAHFKPKPGNDVGLNVVETATSNPYGSVSNGGVWFLEPNGTISSGNFDLKLWFHNQSTFTTGMVNNAFSILNRPTSSALASDWVKPATNSVYVAGNVSAGHVQRNGIIAMGQFGIGLTLYPVSVKSTASNGTVNILPNPFNAEFAVNMNIPNAAQVTVNVYDQAGRLVVQQNAGKLTGNNTLKVNAGNLSEGTYTVVVKGDGQTLHTEKMVKILK